MRPFPLLISPLFASHLTAAVILPFRGLPRTANSHVFSKRNNLTGVAVEDANNILYAANITLGGNPFTVVLDTGRHDHPLIRFSCNSHPASSDLWVNGDIPGAQDTGKPADVSYAIGQAKGMWCSTFYIQAFLIYGRPQGISTWLPWALTITQWPTKP